MSNTASNPEKLEETSSVEPGAQDDDFEPTAEMMVNDFDDERTLDEEEALEEAGGEQDELCDLEKEKDIPLEDLFAMYGYNGEQGAEGEGDAEDADEGGADEEVGEILEEEGKGDDDTPEESSKQEDYHPIGSEIDIDEERDMPISEDEEEDEEEIQQNSNVAIDVIRDDEKTPRSMLHELYKDDPSVTGGSRQLRSGSRPPSEDEEEDDGDYSPEEDDWKKTIMVGSDYQAVIPEGIRKYDDAMPYENEDKLLWDPSGLSENSLNKYLSNVQDVQNNSCTATGVSAIPQGSHVRDDEQALYMLLQCGHNCEEALRRQKINVASAVDTMSLWSEEECRNFEAGLRQYGKDFNLIQQHKVRTRSVSELVQFYYLWKKTERHDVFANKSRLEKKKYTLHPGTTDFMERFLDEQESPASSPNVHSLLSGDPKRQARTPPPPTQSQSDAEVITADEARIINTHFEDIARHLDKESLESLVKLAAVRLANGMPQTSSTETVPVSISRTSCIPSCDSLVTLSTAHSFAQ